jgi:lipid II isoglutaminyl synthase (glutamine-hydrolysing)
MSVSGTVLRICHLYPELMNIYGDRGNVITLAQRCRWRGIGVEVEAVSIGEAVDPARHDLYFMGGGQDREQILVCEDLQEVKREQVHAAVEAGACFLTICGGYQLFGKYFRTYTGEELPGIEVFDAWTVGGDTRFIGNVVAEWEDREGRPRTLVGFENHSGRPYLGPGARPLARVEKGYGNNGEDGFEGCRTANAFGTYLHGSVLPKNPWLADELIRLGLARRHGEVGLEPLDDALEDRAHAAALKRTRQEKRE